MITETHEQIAQFASKLEDDTPDTVLWHMLWQAAYYADQHKLDLDAAFAKATSDFARAWPEDE